MGLVRLGPYEILVGGPAFIKKTHKKEARYRYIVDHQDVNGGFFIDDACIVDIPSVTQGVIYRQERSCVYEGHEVLVLLAQQTQTGRIRSWFPACYVEGLLVGQCVRPGKIKKVNRSW